MKSQQAFTLIEALIATVILAVLIGALVGPLGGLFKMTRSNQQLLENTTVAQKIAEQIVREWQDPSSGAFAKSCISNPAIIPTGVTVTVTDLSENATPVSSPYSLRSCTGPADNIPIKRVHIIAAVHGKPADLTLDIAKP